MTVIFISSSWYLPIWLAVIVFFTYILYMYLKRKDIKIYIKFFINIKKYLNKKNYVSVIWQVLLLSFCLLE